MGCILSIVFNSTYNGSIIVFRLFIFAQRHDQEYVSAETSAINTRKGVQTRDKARRHRHPFFNSIYVLQWKCET